jgi:hypothetical protein
MTEAEKSLPFDIAIVGLGIVGVHQITREVEKLSDDAGVRSWWMLDLASFRI